MKIRGSILRTQALNNNCKYKDNIQLSRIKYKNIVNKYNKEKLDEERTQEEAD